MTVGFNVITGPDQTSHRWGDVVMALSRRLSELEDESEFGDPFALSVTFIAPNRYLRPDWSGVRLGRLSKRHGVLSAEVALPPIPPDDPVTAVLDLADEVVEAARSYARRRHLADDLPSTRWMLRRTRELGPAPVRPGSALPAAPDPGREARRDAFLRITTSTGEDDVDPSEGLLQMLVEDVLDRAEAFVQIDRIGTDGLERLRLERDGRYVRLERLEVPEGGGRTKHVARTRDQEILEEAVVAWAFEAGPMPDDLIWQAADG
ncbi:hypothetical protein [Nocardioides sp. YIM 152588]|uniref:hypothetical protein n=1 Tax=Nocardioides sp. YIM 152588 TaxID=3158259 RepID=UPI0032E3E078